MSDTEPAFRMIDLNEHRLVVTVDDAGRMTTHLRHMCPAQAAALLLGLAVQMRESHPPYPCHWDEQRDAPAPADRPDEPIVARDGSLDDTGRVWTDGAGHRWDLSVKWEDVSGTRWQFTGDFDRAGGPLMRSDDGVEVEPLDLIRSVTGPMRPAAGDAS